ncbi:MAG: hypothetical protein AAFU85_18145 [Planctomycetota bacterium]
MAFTFSAKPAGNAKPPPELLESVAGGAGALEVGNPANEEAGGGRVVEPAAGTLGVVNGGIANPADPIVGDFVVEPVPAAATEDAPGGVARVPN